MNSLKERCNWGEEIGKRGEGVSGKESFVVGGRPGFSGLALSPFGHWLLRCGPSPRWPFSCCYCVPHSSLHAYYDFGRGVSPF
jgi:hypothetical protein